MKKTVFFLLVSFLAGQLIAQDGPVKSDKIEVVWETSGLSVPESVLPIPEKGILYVSNIATQDPTNKEGAGFISILKTDGSVKTLKWSTGLNSPKGMAISNGKLYVTEVDKISAIDLKTGKKEKEYPVEGSQFLNDVAADKEGKVYFTDSGTGTVYILKDGKVSVFVKSDNFPNVNGLRMYDGKLYLGTGDRIVSFSLKDMEQTDFLLNTGGVDGIAILDDETAVFSDWPGTIHIMSKGSEKELLYDTSSSETAKTADFGYNASENLIYVPTFFDNKVVCMKIKE